MSRFLAGLIVGILIGTGGTMTLTKQDIVGAGKTSAKFIATATTVIARHTNPETAKEIVTEIIKETSKEDR